MYHLFSGSFDEKDNFNISLSEYHDLDNEKSIEKLNIYKETQESLNFVRFNFSFSIYSINENEISKQIIKTLNLISKFFNYYSIINIEIKDIKIINYCLNSQSSIFYNFNKQEIAYILIYPIIVSFSDNIKITNILRKILEDNKFYQSPSCVQDHNIIKYYLWKYKTEDFKKYIIMFYRFCINSNNQNYDLIEVKQDDKAFKISDYLIFNVIDLDFKCEYFNLNDISVLKIFERKKELETIHLKDKIKTYDPKELNEKMKILCNELFNEFIKYLKVINEKILEKYNKAIGLYYSTLNYDDREIFEEYEKAIDLYYSTLKFNDNEKAYLLTMDICDIQNKKEEAKISLNILIKLFEKYYFIIHEIIKYKEINEEEEDKEDEEYKEYEEINDYFVSNINYKLYHKFFICFEKLVKINEINLKQIFKDKKINLVELKFIIETMKNTIKYLSDFDDDSQLDIPDVENIFKFFKLVLPYLNI